MLAVARRPPWAPATAPTPLRLALAWRCWCGGLARRWGAACLRPGACRPTLRRRSGRWARWARLPGATPGEALRPTPTSHAPRARPPLRAGAAAFGSQNLPSGRAVRRRAASREQPRGPVGCSDATPSAAPPPATPSRSASASETGSDLGARVRPIGIEMSAGTVVGAEVKIGRMTGNSFSRRDWVKTNRKPQAEGGHRGLRVLRVPASPSRPQRSPARACAERQSRA